MHSPRESSSDANAREHGKQRGLSSYQAPMDLPSNMEPEDSSASGQTLLVISLRAGPALRLWDQRESIHPLLRKGGVAGVQSDSFSEVVIRPEWGRFSAPWTIRGYIVSERALACSCATKREQRSWWLMDKERRGFLGLETGRWHVLSDGRSLGPGLDARAIQQAPVVLEEMKVSRKR